MNRDELRAAVREAIHHVAPEAALDDVSGDADLREALDLDSMDVLNLAIALHRLTGIAVPEVDMPRVVSLDGAVRYLAERAGS